MLLDELNVRAFRGIGQNIPLNLTTPLILIYAPNGTGKTSLCDAVEWLFTSQVARLNDNKEKGKGIQNLFMEGEPPYVECKLRIGDEHLHVRRKGLNEPSKIGLFNGNSWSQIPLVDLLEKLTPNSLPLSEKAIINLSNQKNWLRAVRFLETPTIDLLLNNDNQGSVVRELVFSDLLGIGEIQRREKDLERIVKSLGSKTRLNQEIRNAKDNARKLESEIQVQVFRAKGPIIEVLIKLLNSAAQRLGVVQSSEFSTYEVQLAALQNEYILAEDKYNQQLNILPTLITNANLYVTFNEEIATLNKQRQEKIAAREVVQHNFETTNNLLQSLEREGSRVEALLKAITSLPFDATSIKLKHYWQDLFNLEISIGLKNPKIAEDELLKLYEKQKNEKDRLNKLRQVNSLLSKWQESLRCIKASEQKLSTLQLPTIEEQAEAERVLNDKKKSLIKIETDYVRLTKPLEQLRSAGRNFLIDAKVEQICPLCLHDHGSSIALHQAVTAGLAGLPIAIDTLVNHKHELEKEIIVLEQKFNVYSKLRSDIESTKSEMEKAQYELSEAEKILTIFGFHTDDLINEFFDKRLFDISSTIEDNIARGEILVAEKEKHIYITRQLLETSQEFEFLLERISTFEPSIDMTLCIKDQPLSQWPHIIENTAKVLNVKLEQAKYKVAENQKKMESARTKIQELKQQVATLSFDAMELARNIGIIEAQRVDYEKQWRSVASEEPWALATLEKLPFLLEQKRIELEKAKHELESAREAIVAVKEAESREYEHKGSLLQLTELRKRIHELENELKMRSECEQGIKILSTAKDAFVTQQIRPLCEVITSLYLRAQSNIFIEGIETNNDNGPLRWLARIGDHHLDDTIHMSLGQRQDLALAIFLARARQIGGTFFLDEPLLHLDDLNRVALLDVLRTIVIEQRQFPLRLVITTANYSLVRHFRQKFALIANDKEKSLLRVYRLLGDPRSGVTVKEED